MSKIGMLLAAVFVTALALEVGTATALRGIEIGVFEVIRSTSRAVTFAAEGAEVVCEVTLTWEVHAFIQKFNGASFGEFRNQANTAGCRGGSVTMLAPLEGGFVTYRSFTGTLPRIRSIRIEARGMGVLVSAFGGLARCLYRGNPQFTTGSSEAAFEVIADETIAIPLSSNLGGVTCPRSGVLKGSFRLERALLMSLI